MKLTTEAELAADVLRIPAAKAAELRRVKKWPHVRLGRFDVRYTDDQVAQIVAMQTRTGGAGGASSLPTPTSRSRAARRSA